MKFGEILMWFWYLMAVVVGIATLIKDCWDTFFLIAMLGSLIVAKLYGIERDIEEIKYTKTKKT